MPHSSERFLTPELRAFFVPTHGELPGIEHPAVDHNLRMLYGAEFIEELRGESFGGNAGFELINDSTKVSCAAVNGYAEPEGGRIVKFGNVQYVAPEIVEANSHIGFKVGMSRETFQMMILGFYATGELDDEGKAVLGGTIEAYNFDSEMQAREERERLNRIYGDLGSGAVGSTQGEMGPLRRYTSNRLLRFLKR